MTNNLGQEYRVDEPPSRWLTVAHRISDGLIYLLLIIATGISVLDLVVGLDRLSWLVVRVPQIILLSLGIYFASTVLDRKTVLERTHNVVVRSSAAVEHRLDDIVGRLDMASPTPPEVAAVVRSVRREVPLLPLLTPATEQIFISGNTLIHFAQNFREFLIEKSQSCEVRILILDVGNALRGVHVAAGRLFGEEGSFANELRRSQQALVALARAARNVGGRFEVRAYDALPTLNVIMIDPHTAAGKIQVEMLPYHGSANLRPGLILKPPRQQVEEDLYSMFRQQYEQLWQASRDIVT